jgi:uncharacterized protein
MLHTYTVPTRVFDPWYAERIPYVIAIAELVEQKNLKVVTNLVGCDPGSIEVGMPLEVCFETVVTGLTLPLFRPS